MITQSPDEIARELLPLVRGFVADGPYAVALGGSHAKGRGDALSDVDVYLFADRVLPGEERRERVRRALGDGAEAVSWGRDEEFVQGGTDFVFRGKKVEVWLRAARDVEAGVAAALRGEVRREFVAWTAMGFFGHVVLADLRAVRVIDDPHGMLARWKAAVAAYPEALRDAILRRFVAEAAFWPDNFHYRTAVQRRDVIYTAAIVQQVAHALIQAVFALNREYFPGEKRLAQALDALPARPRDFAARIQAIVAHAGGTSVDALEDQRRELAALVAEIERLAAG